MDFEERRAGPIRYYAGGAGEPVVLVHGLGGWAGNWRAVAPLLARSRRVLVPELPGHGGSEPLRARGVDRSLETYADAVLSVLEAEDAAPAAWVGHSLGTIVSYDYLTDSDKGAERRKSIAHYVNIDGQGNQSKSMTALVNQPSSGTPAVSRG